MPAEFHILLVEDSPSDVLIIRRALGEIGFPHLLTTLSDGASAMAYLDRLSHPSCPSEEVPDLILLDLNLPGPDGGQLLRRIKDDPILRVIPVVVLTTSGRDKDVWQSYHAGANTFVQKPASFEHYRELALTVRDYWGQLATRPPRRPPTD